VREAIPYTSSRSTTTAKATAGAADFSLSAATTCPDGVSPGTDRRRRGAARDDRVRRARNLATLRSAEPSGSISVSIVDALAKLPHRGRGISGGRLPEAQRLVKDTIKEWKATKPAGDSRNLKIYQLGRRLPFEGRSTTCSRLRGIRASRARVDGGAQTRADRGCERSNATWASWSTWPAMAMPARTPRRSPQVIERWSNSNGAGGKNHGDHRQPAELAAAL